MTLDPRLSNYREAYYDADPAFQKVIDEAFKAVEQVFKSHSFPTRNDETAENLVTAIVKFAVLSLGADLNEQLKPPAAASI